MNPQNNQAQNNQHDFIRFALEARVLAFGEFKTKAGRLSPYFFNAGGFSNGVLLGALGQYYAKALLASGIQFEMLYGPAYKGITLAAATAIALAEQGHQTAFAYNRKEVNSRCGGEARGSLNCP